MEGESPRKLAVILHADVVGSTALVQKHEAVFHDRQQGAFRHLSTVIEAYNGIVHESRGDALVAEFSRASDAVSAALLFQSTHTQHNEELDDDIKLELRVGISLGEVVVADGTVTGEGVILAQRLEQLAEPGGIVVQGTVSETVPTRLAFEFHSLGEKSLKGFDRPVRAFAARLGNRSRVPPPEPLGEIHKPTTHPTRRRVGLAAALAAIALVAGAFWHLEREAGIAEQPPGPRIAVMPFDNLGDESGQTFANGQAEDIITALSMFSDLMVFPLQTTRQLKSERADCEDIHGALNARFILEGTVRRAGHALRVTANLLDTRDCTQAWSASYDRDLGDGDASGVFSVQDDITSHVASAIGSADAPAWHSKLQPEMSRRRTDSLEAYECVLTYMEWARKFGAERHKRARDCLERVADAHPDYAAAHTYLGLAYLNEQKYPYQHARPNSLELALPELQKAIELDPRSQRAHHGLAVYRYLTERPGFAAFRLAADEAIAMNPNNSFVLADLGGFIAYSGDWDRGKQLLNRAMELNPRHPRWYAFVFCLDHYRQGEYDDARACFLSMNYPDHQMIQTLLAATYGQLGDFTKANAIVDHISGLHPRFAEDPREPYRTRRFDSDLVESIMDGLQMAGYEVPPPVGDR